MTGQMGHRGGSGDGGRWDLDGGLGLGGERCRVSNTGYYGLEGIRGDWGGGGAHRAFDKRKCCMFHKACCIIGWRDGGWGNWAIASG